MPSECSSIVSNAFRPFTSIARILHSGTFWLIRAKCDGGIRKGVEYVHLDLRKGVKHVCFDLSKAIEHVCFDLRKDVDYVHLDTRTGVTHIRCGCRKGILYITYHTHFRQNSYMFIATMMVTMTLFTACLIK